jgi:hypothetical protein
MPSVTTSSLIQPVVERAPLATPFGAVVARQVSVWPFAARTARLFVLVEPSLPDEPLRQGLLRAMQQGYFASDGYSQTRAVREAALAAHYVLQHHNRDVLPLQQVNAASAVAAVRGSVGFVALAGQAAAFAWRDGELTSQSGVLRLPRPLGLDQDPPITLWRTSLRPGDRLVLVCGGRWSADSVRIIREAISSATTSNAVAQRQIADALGDTSPAGVLVISSSTPALHMPHHLRLVGKPDKPALPLQAASRAHAPTSASPKRLVLPVLGLVLLTLVLLATLVFAPQPRTSSTAHVEGVSPRMAVRLGPSATNIVDMAVGDAALYTLDVFEGAVRAFSLDGVEQEPTSETLLARTGSFDHVTDTHLGVPVAIEYVPATTTGPGSLAVVDQSRAVFQVGADGSLSPRWVPTSSAWQALGALGVDPSGELLFLDSGAHQLLAYPTFSQPVLDPPSLVLSGATAPRLPFERVAQVVGASESVIFRMDDGSVHRLEPSGAVEPLVLQGADSPLAGISAMAADRAGGLYLADSLNARVIDIRLDGTIVRELRAPSLAGVRAVDASVDGQRLFALVDAGILVIDIPSM